MELSLMLHLGAFSASFGISCPLNPSSPSGSHILWHLTFLDSHIPWQFVWTFVNVQRACRRHSSPSSLRQQRRQCSCHSLDRQPLHWHGRLRRRCRRSCLRCCPHFRSLRCPRGRLPQRQPGRWPLCRSRWRQLQHLQRPPQQRHSRARLHHSWRRRRLHRHQHQQRRQQRAQVRPPLQPRPQQRPSRKQPSAARLPQPSTSRMAKVRVIPRLYTLTRECCGVWHPPPLSGNATDL